MEWYGRAIEGGTPWSFVLLFGQVVLLAMLVERTVFLTLRNHINVTMFLDALGKLARAGDVERALKLTRAVDVPATRVCRLGLEGLGKGPFFLADELDRAIEKELPKIRRRLGTMPLLALGVIALGVLGSALAGAGAPSFGGDGPLPFGLDEAHALGLIGVTTGGVALLWSISLRRKAKRAVTDLGKCRAFVLELDSGAPNLADHAG